MNGNPARKIFYVRRGQGWLRGEDRHEGAGHEGHPHDIEASLMFVIALQSVAKAPGFGPDTCIDPRIEMLIFAKYVLSDRMFAYSIRAPCERLFDKILEQLPRAFCRCECIAIAELIHGLAYLSRCRAC
ncbi:hypothetical protein [Agrobacterium vitis]|uniref:hypothetical protein n=1 Tax=Agrobacterium vitis TaxID=373 RepID=UPI00148D5BE8|nr:hypothetical protein [Agrobacterium vitis]NOJ37082.1 hypothetical protein [Agrobacterium vitis]